VDGSSTIYSSADAPGIIYDLLYVDAANLTENREDWAKVVKVWYRIAEFMADEDNTDEVLEILSERVSVKPEEYESFLEGTHILSLDEVLPIWEKGEGLGSVYGSSMVVDKFNVEQGVYERPLAIEAYLDPSITLDLKRE
jgi:NitT/TauT family transport system substrate-binding protein